MMHRKRVCDRCESEILPGTLYVRTGSHLLRDCTDTRYGMSPSTSTDILAQLEAELCERCAPSDLTPALKAIAAKEGRS